MEQSNFFALMARMKNISRWGLMRSTEPENIQEHSLVVAMFAHALALIGKEQFSREIDPGECAVVALYHDAPEILTGDLPTPVKYFNPAIREAYQAVEDSSAQRILNMLPAALQESYRKIFDPKEVSPAVRQIVKAADRISAYVKCLEELRCGNREFERAAAQIKESIDQIDLPEVAYFMDTFMEGFSLTLDELQ